MSSISMRPARLDPTPGSLRVTASMPVRAGLNTSRIDPPTIDAPSESYSHFFDQDLLAWLDNAVQRAKEKYQSLRELEERAAEQEALKRRLGSKFCRDVFTWLESVELCFNSRFGGQVLTVRTLGNEGGRTLQVLARPVPSQEVMAEIRYEDSGSHLVYTIGGGQCTSATQSIRLVLSEGSVQAEIGTERFSSEQLGKRIVEELLHISGSSQKPS